MKLSNFQKHDKNTLEKVLVSTNYMFDFRNAKSPLDYKLEVKYQPGMRRKVQLCSVARSRQPIKNQTQKKATHCAPRSATSGGWGRASISGDGSKPVGNHSAQRFLGACRSTGFLAEHWHPFSWFEMVSSCCTANLRQLVRRSQNSLSTSSETEITYWTVRPNVKSGGSLLWPSSDRKDLRVKSGF